MPVRSCARCGSESSNFQLAVDRRENQLIRELCASCGRYKGYVERNARNYARINVPEVYRKETRERPKPDDLFDDEPAAPQKAQDAQTQMKAVTGSESQPTPADSVGEDEVGSPSWWQKQEFLDKTIAQWLARYPYLREYPLKRQFRMISKLYANELKLNVLARSMGYPLPYPEDVKHE